MILNGTLVIGQDQDKLGGGFSVIDSFRGAISQVNIWDRALSLSELRSIYNCQTRAQGNIFSQDVDSFELHNVEETTAGLDSFCSQIDFVTLFKSSGNVQTSVELCQSIGASVHVPRSAEENRLLLADISKPNFICRFNSVVWLGISDKEDEGVWRRFLDDSIITNQFFSRGYPKGGTNSSCVQIDRRTGNWQDRNCENDGSSCTVCVNNNQRPLRLRGLCFEYETQTLMEVLGYWNGAPYLHGFHGLLIYRTEELDEWLMVDTQANKTLARIVLQSASSFPTGRRTWTLVSRIL